MKLSKNSLLVDLRCPAYYVVDLANRIFRPPVGKPERSFASVPLPLREEFILTLRSLLDRWIDSGRREGNIDEPLKRNVYRQPLDGLELLADVLWKWNRRHAANVLVMQNGERNVSVGGPKPWIGASSSNNLFEQYMNFTQREPLPETKREAREIAIYWIQELLDSPDRWLIARCDNPECRRPYYVRQRVRKGLIKNGTYCKNCKNAASLVRVKASLERRKQMLVECAADVWDTFKPSSQYQKKSDWMAMKVNRLLDLDIKGKWITQNQTAIEAEVERRKRGPA
ncbi:MAG TPA: hypothetical protein VIY49_17185 [Bryobacteraceae bacterium]